MPGTNGVRGILKVIDKVFAAVFLLNFAILGETLAADDVILVDASQDAVGGVLDVSSLGANISISDIDELTEILTADDQSIQLDGLELQAISDADSTLTIKGNGSVDIINSGLTLPNDGSTPTVANLLGLEFEGLAADKSLVPERLTVAGSHSDAIAAYWIVLDQAYVGAGDYYNLAINTSFVYLGNDYANYLLEGNDARLDLVKLSADRLQTLHDNLLGNLGDSPITGRFTNLSEPDPRTVAGDFFGERPYNRGTVSDGLYSDLDVVSSVMGWDFINGIRYPLVLPSPFSVFDDANNIVGTGTDDNLFGGSGDDTFDGGTGLDIISYTGDMVDYTISSAAGTFTVTDSTDSRDGTDMLENVELLEFADATLFLVGGNDFTVQSAINAASSGDTILVGVGTYSEEITIDTPLTILGEQAGVDARGRDADAETVIEGNIILRSGADNTLIDGFTLQEGASIGGEFAAIYLANGASDVTVQNTLFIRSGEVDGDAHRGILTTFNGDNIDLIVSKNSFSGWATGVYLNPGATNADVSDNDFDGNFVGMSIDGPDNTNVTGNFFDNNLFEALGIGPGADSPSLLLTGNDFSDNETQIGVYTDITLDLSGNNFDSRVVIAGEGTVYSSLQNAIDAAANGDTLLAYPGNYSEAANYDGNSNSNSGDNPLGLLINKSITIQGVDADGNVITDTADISAIINSGTQSGWGTNFFVTAEDVSIQGLQLVATSSSSTVNKAIEVIQDNFTLQNSIVTAEDGLTMTTAVQINDEDVPSDGSFAVSAITDYTLMDSQLYGLVTITNGPGIGHSTDSLSMRITDNEFLALPGGSNDGIVVTGNDDTDAGNNAAAALPSEISGNDFTDASSILWVRGDDSQTFPTTMYVENLVNDNTVPVYAYAIAGDGEVAVGTSGSVSSLAVRRELTDFSSEELINAKAIVSQASDASSPITTVLQLFDQDVTPDILYGSGNSNGSFVRSVSNNVEVGLRIKDRFVGDNHSNGDGTYSPEVGFFSGDSGPAIWNYDFAINLNQDGGGSPRLFDEVSIELQIDLDPSPGTSFLTFDPLSVWTDNAYGDNTTANGDGDDSAETNANLGSSSNFYITQNSQNIGWLFNTLGDTLFDVTQNGTYDFRLVVSDLNNNVLAQTAMQVLAGTGGEAGDREIAALRFLDGNLQSCVQDTASTQGWTHVSEMTSLSCVGLSLVSVMGVDQLSSLTSLNLSNNQLTMIDIDNLNALQTLTITGNPLDQETIAYLDSLDGNNGLQITRVVVPPPIPTGGGSGGGSDDDSDEEEPETPVVETEPSALEVIADNNDAIEEEIENIVISDDDDEITEETVQAIDTALDNASALAEDTKAKIDSGEITGDDALQVLDTLGSALDLAGEATGKGADIDETNVTDSVESITGILNALDEEEPLDQTQVEQLQQVAQKAVDTVADLIDEESTEEEVEGLVTDIEELLASTENAGADLDEEIVVAAQTLSQKALDNTLDDVVSEAGIEPTDTSDVEATQALLRENNALLDKVLEIASVELPSSAELDTVALVDNLEANGLDEAAAEELSNDLAQFVNPVGVNLELTNGTSVNALDSMVENVGDSVGDSSATISVDELTGSLLVDVGDTEIPVNVAKVAIVPPAVPEGVTILPDGSALSVSDGVAVTVVPAPKDPIGLVSSLSSAVGDIKLETSGGITITSGDGETFSGTFGFDDAQSTETGTVDEVTFNVPEDGDPSDPEYTFSVDYPDGSRQNIAPFVADDSFFDSLDSRGLSFNTSRSTGVVTVIDEATNTAAQFRPDYFVSPLTSEDQDFFENNADETGIAYRAVDVNGDGILDFEAISSTGVQVIYGL